MSRMQLILILLAVVVVAALVWITIGSGGQDDGSLASQAPGATEADATDVPSAQADGEESTLDIAERDLFTLLDAPDDDPTASEGDGTISTFALEQEEAGHVYTRDEAITIAERFNLITALRGSFAGHADAMREANPDLILSVYLNAAFAQAPQSDTFPNDWYLVDAEGERVVNDFDLWMMDVGNEGWQQERVDTCRSFIEQSGADGCFLDNLGTGTLWPPSLTGQPINPRTGEEYTPDEWITATQALSDGIHEAIGPDFHVIANGLVSGQKFYDPAGPTSVLLDVSDYGLAETFVRPARLPVDESRPEGSWRQDVNMLVDAAAAGQRVMAVSKVWVEDADQGDVDRWHEFALASFMLGDNGQHWFSFSGDQGASRLEVHPWWDVELGAPAGGYVRDDDGIYARRYEGGLVIANPTDESREILLDASYTRLDGQQVDALTLPPRSGAVLTAG